MTASSPARRRALPQGVQFDSSGKLVKCSHYDLLGLPPVASTHEVKAAFRKIARTFHPDKSRSLLSPEEAEFWARASEAFKVLSNPTDKLQYDMEHFPSEDRGESQEEQIRLDEALLRQHLVNEANMRQAYEESLLESLQQRGLVIRYALYGDLRYFEEYGEQGEVLPASACLPPVRFFPDIEPGKRSTQGPKLEFEKALVGPVMNCTVGIQCLVDSHRIASETAISSSAILGLYNPSPMKSREAFPACLYVAYEFRGRKHEVTLVEWDKLRLPMKAHMCSNQNVYIGPRVPLTFFEFRDTLVKKREKEWADESRGWARRSLKAVALVGGIAGSVYLLKLVRESEAPLAVKARSLCVSSYEVSREAVGSLLSSECVKSGQQLAARGVEELRRALEQTREGLWQSHSVLRSSAQNLMSRALD